MHITVKAYKVSCANLIFPTLAKIFCLSHYSVTAIAKYFGTSRLSSCLENCTGTIDTMKETL